MPRRADGSVLGSVLSAVAALWLIFAIQAAAFHLAGIQLAVYGGVRPWEWSGLLGLLTAHLLHASLGHLIANSSALLVLGLVAASYSRALTGYAIAASALLAGIAAWLLGDRGSVHIGASGVVFGLIGFLIGNGIFHRGCLPLVIAVLVLGLFGSAVLINLLPREGISWEMHAGGLAGGLIASWGTRGERAR